MNPPAWLPWALAAAVFAALTAILAKVGVEEVGADLATFVRTLVVAAALGLLLAATNRWRPPGAVSGRSLAFLALSGLATGASWLCFMRALQLGEASRVAPVDKLSVVLVALFGAAVLGERLLPVNWLGVGLVAAGAVLVAWRG